MGIVDLQIVFDYRILDRGRISVDSHYVSMLARMTLSEQHHFEQCNPTPLVVFVKLLMQDRPGDIHREFTFSSEFRCDTLVH